ncbi:MAG TPA: MerR family transcriptional regulator [Bacillota bacterium]|nr:MerR family transcriptional regulator [Bacillota bacterium]
MDYTVYQLAELSGVSKRTLRYYEEIGLLSPSRVDHNHYRQYSGSDVDQLQQILFYKTLGISLLKIKTLLSDPDYDKKVALENHLSELNKQKRQIDLLIENVRQTIASVKGEISMNDMDKFEGLKQKMLNENEEKYGQEIRGKFGNAAVDASNAKIKGMSKEKYAQMEKRTKELNAALRIAFQQNDPNSELAQKVCELHKEWLLLFWPEGSYTAEAHLSLAQGYVDDVRFTAYYEQIAPGCAVFLRDAIKIFCKK